MRKHRKLASDSKIREIAKRGLPLPEAAALAGLARTNYRKRAQKLGYDVKPERAGRPRLHHRCRIRGCTAPHSSNGLCRAHFNQWYYRKKADKFKERAAKQREAMRQQVSREELERLRIPENRGESLGFGPDKKIVHLECGWLGDDLTHHIHHCPIKPEGWSAYWRRWGFDPSSPPVSPKQRKAYSETQRGNWASSERRSTMARHRWGKGTGPRLAMRRILNSKILEIVAANPGVSIKEGAALAGMSPVGFYKRVMKLGDLRSLVPAPRPQREFVRLAADARLRRSIAGLSQDFPAEQFLQFCMDNLHHGPLTASQFAVFILHLEKELRERQEWITEIAAEIAGRKPAQSAMRLGNRVFERVRAGLKEGNAGFPKPAQVDGNGSVEKPAKGRKPRPRGRAQDTLARLTIAADILLTNPDAAIYSMAPALFPEQNYKERRYANARQLFQRNKSQLERERARLKALPADSRARVVEQAKRQLRST